MMLNPGDLFSEEIQNRKWITRYRRIRLLFSRKGNAFADEILDNVVSIYATVADTGNHYIETKANARGSLPNIIVIGMRDIS